MLRRRALWFICASVVLWCIGTVLFAQQPPASPTFDVASVKQNKSGDPRQQMGFEPGGRFNAVQNSPKLLLPSISATSVRCGKGGFTSLPRR